MEGGGKRTEKHGARFFLIVFLSPSVRPSDRPSVRPVRRCVPLRWCRLCVIVLYSPQRKHARRRTNGRGRTDGRNGLRTEAVHWTLVVSESASLTPINAHHALTAPGAPALTVTRVSGIPLQWGRENTDFGTQHRRGSNQYLIVGGTIWHFPSIMVPT